MRSRVISLGLALALLVSCASPSKLRPTVSSAISKPFVSERPTSMTFETINDELDTRISRLMRASGHKSEQDWELGDSALVGGIAATLGFLADKTGLANTGLGVAGISLAGRQHYQLDKQLEVHLSTLDSLVCIKNRIGGLTDSTWEKARSAPNITEKQAAELLSAKRDVIEAIQVALNDYARGILDVRSPTTIRADIQNLVNEQVKTKENVDNAARQVMTLSGPQKGVNGQYRIMTKQEKDELENAVALTQFTGLKAAVLECRVTSSGK